MNINNAHAGSVFERLNLENGREQFVSSYYRPYDLSLGRPAAASIVSRNRVPLGLQIPGLRSRRLASIQNVIEWRSITRMVVCPYSRLVATILVALSIVAFTPRVLHPHVRLSCGSTDGTTFSGPQRFTDDSSRMPDLKAGYEANGVPLPQDLKLLSEDQVATPSLGFRFETPFVRPIVRRNKLLPSRASSQDPL